MASREIAFLVAPIVFAAALLAIRPRLRRIKLDSIVLYIGFLVAVLSAALLFVAYVAGARVVAFEIAVVVWFAIGLRLAFELWRSLLGRWGQKWSRWRRIARRSPVKYRAAPLGLRFGAAAIPWLKAAATLVIFAPAALAIVLTHRFKLMDGTDPKTLLAAPFESIRIATEDGLELDGWFVPGPGATRTLLICHGAGANKGNFIWFLPPLLHQGYNLLLFDFRAHGGSGGRLCTYGVLEERDVRAAVDWLRRERSAQSQKIVGLGSSLGALALARAAQQDARIDALVLDSPFVAPRALAHHLFRKAGPIGRGFADLVLWEMSIVSGADFLHASAEPAVANLGDRPVWIVHGDDDVLMPTEHAHRLDAAASGPHELWLGPGPHSNIITTEPEEYAQRLFAFLARHLGPPG